MYLLETQFVNVWYIHIRKTELPIDIPYMCVKYVSGNIIPTIRCICENQTHIKISSIDETLNFRRSKLNKNLELFF